MRTRDGSMTKKGGPLTRKGSGQKRNPMPTKNKKRLPAKKFPVMNA